MISKKVISIRILILFLLMIKVSSALVPYPKSVVFNGDTLFLPVEISYRLAAFETQSDFSFLQQVLLKEGNFSFRQVPSDLRAEELITFRRATKAMIQRDEYQLTIDKNISITAREDGFFHAIQTLRQLIVHDTKGRTGILKGNIQDYPAYEWRGMHLDVARHFFTKEEVFRFLDLMAIHKMNRFHWHLTDDQGWRIPIREFPLLTIKGGARSRSMVGHYLQQKWDTVPYQYAYTSEEIKAIVRYAADRHIVIVPEIEMPGHAQAALSAYPEYSCTGHVLEAADTWGVFDDVFCTKKESIEFMKAILNEVADYFPGEYIHIGGDECPVTRWKTCNSCQDVIRKNKLKGEEELEHHFLSEIHKHLQSINKKMMGWDEIIDGNPVGDAAVMSWRGTSGGVKAAKLKRKVVMSPGNPCYFDHYQCNPALEPVAIGGMNTLVSVYNYSPIPSELSAEDSHYVMGAQANLWSEYIFDFVSLQKRALPRMCALAEVVWGKNNTAPDFYTTRLPDFLNYIEKEGFAYSNCWWTPDVTNNARILSFSHPLQKNNPDVKILVNRKEQARQMIEKDEMLMLELTGHKGPRTATTLYLKGTGPDSIKVFSKGQYQNTYLPCLTDGIVSGSVFPDTKEYGIYSRADTTTITMFGVKASALTFSFSSIANESNVLPKIIWVGPDEQSQIAQIEITDRNNEDKFERIGDGTGKEIRIEGLPEKGASMLLFKLINQPKGSFYLTEISY